MFRAMRSFFSSLKASYLFGRASRLRGAGNKEEALNVARQCLEILRAPWVERYHPNESSVLLCAVLLLEQVAYELNKPGADDIDLSDALICLQSLPPDSLHKILGNEDLVPYIEARLGVSSRRAQ